MPTDYAHLTIFVPDGRVLLVRNIAMHFNEAAKWEASYSTFVAAGGNPKTELLEGLAQDMEIPREFAEPLIEEKNAIEMSTRRLNLFVMRVKEMFCLTCDETLPLEFRALPIKELIKETQLEYTRFQAGEMYHSDKTYHHNTLMAMQALRFNS